MLAAAITVVLTETVEYAVVARVDVGIMEMEEWPMRVWQFA